MIYTSYFASKKWRDKKAVSIARYTPKGIVVDGYPVLYPPADLLWAYKQGQINQEQYAEWYTKAVLNKINSEVVANDLCDKVMLCYEKSDSFCHRHIVAQWLRYNGYECEEL